MPAAGPIEFAPLKKRPDRVASALRAWSAERANADLVVPERPVEPACAIIPVPMPELDVYKRQASADADSTAPENVRREKLFIEPPAAFVSHARLGQPHQPLPMGALGPAPMRSQSRDHSERLPAIEPVIS